MEGRKTLRKKSKTSLPTLRALKVQQRWRQKRSSVSKRIKLPELRLSMPLPTPTLRLKPKKKDLVMKAANPINLFEQEYHFFWSKYRWNPVFHYESDIMASKMRGFFPLDDIHVTLAVQILESCIRFYGGRESRYNEVDGGDLVPQDEVEPMFREYIEQQDLGEPVNIVFSNRALAPTSITHDHHGKPRFKIKIALPIAYRRNRILGVLHHEVGTHLLRKINDQKQPWSRWRDKYRLKNHTSTEEGLASINALLDSAHDSTRKPYLWQAAIHYYTAYMASKMSFSELFAHMARFIDDPKRRWKQWIRAKRGVIDTSEPGGFYKDQAYLIGAAQILRQRETIDFTKLYSGKITLDDVQRPEIDRILVLNKLKLPSFFDNMGKYKFALGVIARTNHID